MAQLRQEDLRVLEQTRQRLYQLSQSIGSLRADVSSRSPMPPWDSLQLSASILAQNLESVTDHMKTHSELFERMIAYPSTNFPGRTQEGLISALLRKKLEPGVERWVEEGRAMALQVGTGQTDQGDGLEEKWRAAKGSIGERVARAAVTHRRDEYTAEEREMGIENVNTGLQRPIKLGGDDGDSESESDEDEDEDEEMKDSADIEKAQGPVRSLDEIVRFMATGLAPEDELKPVHIGEVGYRR